jgi:PAS domain S-box-containing protein
MQDEGVVAFNQGGLLARFASGRRRILEMIVTDEPVDACLDEICRAVEYLDASIRVVIARLDTGERIVSVAAPTVNGLAAALLAAPMSAFLATHRNACVSPAEGAAAGLRLGADWDSACLAMKLSRGFATPVLDRCGVARAVVFLGVDGVRELGDLDVEAADMTAELAGLVFVRSDAQGESLRCDLFARRAIQAMGTAVYTTDAHGRVTMFNDAAADLWGWRPEPGQLWCGSWKIFHADGSPMALDACPMAVTLREGRAVRGEEIVVERPDGSRRDVAPHPSPLFDGAGRLVGAVNALVDITDRRAVERELARHREELEAEVQRRTAELRDTFERLRTAERLAMMGTLSAGLGHDMGNLLLPVRVRLDSLAAEPLSDQAREDVEAIRTAAEYLRRLAGGLRLLSLDPQRGAGTHWTDLPAWWADAEGVLRSVLPRGITLEADLGHGVPGAAMSKAGLTQVVFNLVQNAGDAMRDRASGRVLIRTRAEGGKVLVSVIDDGPGMSPQVRARCMEPFFTTKSRAMSTGLGLSLVHGLVADAGGTVELWSEEGRGTSFTLRLDAAHPGAAEPAPTDTGSALVLLRDPRMRSFVSTELRSMGMTLLADTAAAGGNTLFVLDDPAHLAGIPSTARALVFGQAPRRDGPTVCLADEPGVVSVRTAVRELVRLAPTEAPQRNAKAG